ncbi:MAG: YggS family pyridoxal phosphate-dependent enzyme [Eubacterium sp.]|nr:YggS family pyridoxal phosphate-dependent enzyme [Eubacterium sp.]
MLKDNYKTVLKNIEDACRRVGRDPDEVTLISVSKTKPVEDIRDVYEGGCRDFGENKVQEIVKKVPELPDDIRWHMIGHLQTNKVKQVIDKACLIHSVDSVHLAEEIEKQAARLDMTVDILLEVNIAREETKFGMMKSEAIDMVKEIAGFPHIRIVGLMTIAPYVDDPENNRPIFRALKDLSVDIMKENIDNVSMGVISMGMSNDYVVAVEEGATLVRVGTSIFGERNYAI